MNVPDHIGLCFETHRDDSNPQAAELNVRLALRKKRIEKPWDLGYCAELNAPVRILRQMERARKRLVDIEPVAMPHATRRTHVEQSIDRLRAG